MNLRLASLEDTLVLRNMDSLERNATAERTWGSSILHEANNSALLYLATSILTGAPEKQ